MDNTITNIIFINEMLETLNSNQRFATNHVNSYIPLTRMFNAGYQYNEFMKFPDSSISASMSSTNPAKWASLYINQIRQLLNKQEQDGHHEIKLLHQYYPKESIEEQQIQRTRFTEITEMPIIRIKVKCNENVQPLLPRAIDRNEYLYIQDPTFNEHYYRHELDQRKNREVDGDEIRNSKTRREIVDLKSLAIDQKLAVCKYLEMVLSQPMSIASAVNYKLSLSNNENTLQIQYTETTAGVVTEAGIHKHILDKDINCLAITGPPGTGKTHLVLFISKIKLFRLLNCTVYYCYIAPSNGLVQNMKQAIKEQNVSHFTCKTLCSFALKILNQNFFKYRNHVHNLAKPTLDKFLDLVLYMVQQMRIQYASQKGEGNTVKLQPNSTKSSLEAKIVKLYFIDEITMSSPQLLTFIKLLIFAECLYNNMSGFIVWMGDLNQLLPIWTTSLIYDIIMLPLKDISLDTLKRLMGIELTSNLNEGDIPSPTPNDQDHDNGLDPFDDDDIDSMIDVISHCSETAININNEPHPMLEYGNIINTYIMKRTTDRQFVDIISNIKNLTNVDELEHILKTMCPPVEVNTPFQYQYPLERFIETGCPLFETSGTKEIRNLAGWFLANQVHKWILPELYLTYTNMDVSYCNLSFADSVYQQLLQMLPNDFKIHDLIRFQIFYPMECKKKIYNKLDIPMLPLMRFFPYTYEGLEFPHLRGQWLYLLEWEVDHIVMLNPTQFDGENAEGSIIRIPIEKYKLSHFIDDKRQLELYGFPLRFVFASTFHSCQGKTINQPITINFNLISKRAFYVAVSRVPSLNNIKRIIVSEFYKNLIDK